MPGVVIRKLFDSFDELDRSISAAKRALSKRDPIPLSLLRRINEYEEILGKQRKLAQELCRHVVAENWDEVGRHTKLINAFSAMIYSDAVTLTQGILTGSEEIPMDLEELTVS